MNFAGCGCAYYKGTFRIASENTNKTNEKPADRTADISANGSNGADTGNFGVGMEVEVWCRGDVGGQAPPIFTFTPRLGIAWFVASHGWVARPLGWASLLCI